MLLLTWLKLLVFLFFKKVLQTSCCLVSPRKETFPQGYSHRDGLIFTYDVDFVVQMVLETFVYTLGDIPKRL
jgi:hypothetical protein